VTASPDARLDELFVRYWDDALGPAELAELADRLRADPAERDRFRLLCLHTVAAGERRAVARTAESPPTRPAARLSRRRVLQYGVGLAAGVAAGVTGWRLWPGSGAGPVRLAATRGVVKLRTADGGSVPPGGVVPPGGTVATSGLNSTADLAFPDGSALALTGDTAVSVSGDGRRVVLHQGNAFADVRPQTGDAAPLVLATPEADLVTRDGVLMALGHAPRATEVGVRQGRVMVSAPSGVTLAIVHSGEFLTVRPGGDSRKERLSATPDEFALDLARPLPDDWPVGRREVTPDGPILRPEFWPDPYYQHKEMYQIRSDKRWTLGFVRLFPESVLRVRYRVDAPGAGQVIACVRTDEARPKYAGVIEWNGVFGRGARAGGWQWLEVEARGMLDNMNAPTAEPPWVGFLLIFNTYTADLGLRVAEYRVTRPGGRA
jgi:ferric-dicitrate binding protein FerR (iron transport regulator)